MITSEHQFLVASRDGTDQFMLPRMGNRHGLITGATGTGKTVTLQTLAESFSQLGVPVFLADVKGDLSGIAAPGEPTGKIASRIAELKLEERGYVNQGMPTCFWDVFGKSGHPLRTTISEMGPLLLSRILGLNEVQSGLMHIVFRIADDNGLLLLDLKDLRSMLKHVSDEKQRYQDSYGNISAASVGAIQRGLLRLEEEGGTLFFGEPALNIDDLLQTDERGYGQVNVLAADVLINSPKLYSTLLLWLLSALYEKLPERGDQDKPVLVFFFDEAHLLFNDAPAVLLQKIDQVTRLIRSKGVGVYFVSQNPSDIPNSILGQLGNRVQHALRAFTPADQKAVKAAAASFRANPAFSTEKAIGELGVGEALVSFLDEKGAPTVVERSYILPPQSRVGPLSAEERSEFLKNSLLAGVYEEAVDRESAYEILASRAADAAQEAAQAKELALQQKEALKQQAAEEKLRAQQERLRLQQEARAQAAAEKQRLQEQARQQKQQQTLVNALARQAERSISSPLGKAIGGTIVRGVLGSLFGVKK